MSSLHYLPNKEKREMAIKMLSQERRRTIGALMTFELYDHPFGLASLDPSYTLIYLGAGSSSLSLEQMCYYLQLNIASIGKIDSEDIKDLRIIYGQEKTPTRHRVYFEVLTSYAYYMSGGANDFNSGGIRCKECLEIIFDYLAELANIEIEKVELDYKIHYSARSLIGIAKRADSQEVYDKNSRFLPNY